MNVREASEFDGLVSGELEGKHQIRTVECYGGDRLLVSQAVAGTGSRPGDASVVLIVKNAGDRPKKLRELAGACLDDLFSSMESVGQYQSEFLPLRKRVMLPFMASDDNAPSFQSREILDMESGERKSVGEAELNGQFVPAGSTMALVVKTPEKPVKLASMTTR